MRCSLAAAGDARADANRHGTTALSTKARPVQRTHLGSIDPLREVTSGLAIGLGLGMVAALSTTLAIALAILVTIGYATLGARLRPFAWLLSLIVAIPLTSAMPRGALLPVVNLNEVVLVIAAFLTLVFVVFARRPARISPLLLTSTLVFAIGTSLVPLLSYELRSITLTFDEVISLVAPLQYPVLLWMAAHIPAGERDVRSVVRWMIASGGVVALIAMLQALNVGPVRSWLLAFYPSEQALSAEAAIRVTSTFGAWNALGVFLVTTLLLIAATHVDERGTRAIWLIRICGALALLALLATNLFSGIIGSFIGFLLIKRFDPRGLSVFVPIAAVALAGLALLLPEILLRIEQQSTDQTWIPQTLMFRWSVWTEIYWPRIVESPIWGVRPSFDGLSFPFPESQYVFYLYRSGIASLVAHVLWLSLTAAWLLRVLRRSKAREVRSLIFVVLALMVVLSLIGTINPVFTYSGTMDYFWIMLGLIAHTDGRTRETS